MDLRSKYVDGKLLQVSHDYVDKRISKEKLPMLSIKLKCFS
jgi:hypothetical protein